MTPKPHPQTTPAATVERILALALEHPEWGCVRVADALGGTGVSSPTVQKILIKAGLGQKPERLARLEQLHFAEGRALGAEIVTQIERANPRFRERAAAPAAPGALVAQGSFAAGTFAGLGKIHVHAAVDTYSGFAFAYVHPGTSPAAHVSLLHADMLPFLTQRRFKLLTVATEQGWDFERHPYPQYLRMRGIAHQLTPGRGMAGHGFLEAFHRTYNEGFLAAAFPVGGGGPASRDAMQRALDAWLYQLNQTPLPGYPTLGASPAARLEAAVRAAWEAAPLGRG